MDLTQSQAESMYKKIKIKSPNKKSAHGKDNSNSAAVRETHPSTFQSSAHQPINSVVTPRTSNLSANANIYKQTTSSAMKR